MAIDHMKTPFYSKLESYAKSDVIKHDVPGHKLGQIHNEISEYAGMEIYKLDANAPRGLDNLNQPRGVIMESSVLMADAFGAQKAYFLTGGTTMGILSMIMYTCRAKEEIILPRNVHKSAINALILSGAIPVFVKPYIDKSLGIANHMPLSEVKKTIDEHPHAKALFIINPTYYGVTSDLEEMTDYAHQHDMKVLVDEAHGSHFPFSKLLPISSMQAGADLASCSLHKTVGSLTQSSILITQGTRIDQVRLRSTINMLQSTSPSSLLLGSLDVARKYIYFNGEEKLGHVIQMAEETRKQIDQISGLTTISKDYFVSVGAFDYDNTKILIKVSDLGISGFQAYQELVDIYHIQLELSETHVVLAVLSLATTQKDLDALVDGLQKLSDTYSKQKLNAIEPKVKYRYPDSYVRPREAYHAPKKYMLLEDAVDEIAAESIMIYPPGIPIVIPGEIISQDIIDDLEFYKNHNSTILSDADNGYVKVIDKEEWKKWSDDDDE
jgi:lysine decarboxylase